MVTVLLLQIFDELVQVSSQGELPHPVGQEITDGHPLKEHGYEWAGVGAAFHLLFICSEVFTR